MRTVKACRSLKFQNEKYTIHNTGIFMGGMQCSGIPF